MNPFKTWVSPTGKILLGVMLAATVLCMTDLSLVSAAQVGDNLPAFPGAEGAAKFTPGGRGGDVYHVTNMNPSGEGSLAYGIETADGPRTIVFDIGGTIHFDETFNVRKKKRLTIAGQTAPGDGVTLRFDDGGLRITDCEDIIITHLRLVNGSNATRAENLRTDGSKNILLSHLSIRWGGRNNFVVRPDGPLTAQYWIHAEPTDRQKGGWFGHMRPEQGKYNITVRKSLGIHQYTRKNMFQIGRYEFINNVTFNGGFQLHRPYYIMHPPRGAHQRFHGNIIGNVMIDGWNPPPYTLGFGRKARVYINDNMRDSDPRAPFSPKPADDNIVDNTILDVGGYRGDQFEQVNRPLSLKMARNLDTKPVSPRQAYIDVLSRSGASIVRDVHDHRYVRDIMNKNAPNKNSRRPLTRWLDDIPGDPFPKLDPGTPPHSAARDGIPDFWKEKQGLDSQVAYHQRFTDEGYTYLEKYLHWCLRHSLPPPSTKTRIMIVSTAYGKGGHATVSCTEGHKNIDASGNGSITVGQIDGTPIYGLLRFDISEVEPGMLNDAVLELSILELNGAGQFRVLGLDHDRDKQIWPDGYITPEDAPALKAKSNSIEIIRDDVILLGDLEFDKDIARLTNPNLAVFLNLAMYYRGQKESDLVTLLFKPLSVEGVPKGTVEFFTDNREGNGFVPRLILDGIPR